ncbi:MAG: helix-turn-helix domain-containing protein [Oscillospiraceae bacterium]|nr:helix-turn-helix domain-containing protein [Oscillospiraceae bacterium]
MVLRSRTQSDLANEMHISHQAISKRLRKIMRKLRAMLQDLE